MFLRLSPFMFPLTMRRTGCHCALQLASVYSGTHLALLEVLALGGGGFGCLGAALMLFLLLLLLLSGPSGSSSPTIVKVSAVHSAERVFRQRTSLPHVTGRR